VILDNQRNRPLPPHTNANRAKELIRNLIAVNPHHRPSASQCLNHPWVQGAGGEAAGGGTLGGAEPLLTGAHARLKEAYAVSLGGGDFAAAMAAAREAEAAAAEAAAGGAGR